MPFLLTLSMEALAIVGLALVLAGMLMLPLVFAYRWVRGGGVGRLLLRRAALKRLRGWVAV